MNKRVEEAKAAAQRDSAANVANVAALQVPPWLRYAGYAALGLAGTLTIAVGAASYPLSGLLIRPRLKRISQLKSPHLKQLIRRSGILFEDVTIPSFDKTRLYGR
jgi:hypothetical protein